MSKDKMSLHGPHDRYVACGKEDGRATIWLKPEFFKMSWDDQMMDMRRVVYLLKPRDYNVGMWAKLRCVHFGKN